MPVNTRFAESEVDYMRRGLRFGRYVFEPGEPRCPTATPLAVEDLGPDDLAAIFYTSGTTGFPKGAMTAHENFLSNIETAIRVPATWTGRRAARLRDLVSVPLFHVTGCNSQLLRACSRWAGAQ